MNSLYTLALRQSSSVQHDIEHLRRLRLSASGSSASDAGGLRSQIGAGLDALARTADDYDEIARREIVQPKRDKALSRVARFRDERQRLRKQFDELCRDENGTVVGDDGASTSTSPAAATATASARRRASITSTASLRSHGSSAATYANAISNAHGTGLGRRMDGPSPAYDAPQQRYGSSDLNGVPPAESPFTARANGSATPSEASTARRAALGLPTANARPGATGPGRSAGSALDDDGDARTNAALSESSFLANTSQTLDMYLAQGQAVLGDLQTQRDLLKGTKRRLLSAANQLGLSRDTIHAIDRRTTGDNVFLALGCLATLVCFYLILRYLG